jgi:predicted ATPase with chaperone activity
LDEFCPTSESGRALLDSLTRLHDLSACRRADLLRVARTIADLDPDRDPREPLDRECLATAAMFLPRAP